ncbi:TM2 domain-containing protein [Nocardioides sp. BGMRC 2183]|nr:TM2 domain-containing protein [Nocardioides sp. BGMRC 2183]
MTQPPWGEGGYQPYEPGSPGYGHHAGGQPPRPPLIPGVPIDPMTGEWLSDKSKVAAGLLQLLLPFIGVAGVGRLYAGHVGVGLTQLLGTIVSYLLMCVLIGFLTAPLFLLWSFIDGIVLIASNSPRDGRGRVMR